LIILMGRIMEIGSDEKESWNSRRDGAGSKKERPIDRKKHNYRGFCRKAENLTGRRMIRMIQNEGNEQ